MKKNNLLSLLLFLFYIGVSVSQESRQIRATYEYLNLDLNETYQVNLQLNDNSAYSDIKKKSFTESSSKIDDFGSVDFNIESNDTIGDQFYMTNQKVIYRTNIYHENKFIPVIVTEDIPKLEWNLENETKEIGDFLCEKAILNFRGRDYIAWYTRMIPTRFGPWKFNGLPGLIVYLETDDKSIVFKLNHIQTLPATELLPPTGGKQISFEEYVYYEEKVVDDFLKRLKSKLPRGSKIQVNSIGKSKKIERILD